ncbi:multicopper oxidase, partial [Pseudomonas savastanoi pv. glycinea str. race 4]
MRSVVVFEVPPFMSFTRRQILTGIAGLAVVGL